MKHILQLARGGTHALLLAGALLVSSCSGPQSTLNPAGREAERLADLFWLMTIGALVIWLAVIALTFYSIRSRPEPLSPRQARRWIVWGGAVVPTIVLTALLIYGLIPIPALLAPAPAGSLKIVVAGEQWWWRVRYEPPGGSAVELANEIRLPVGAPVEFQLSSPDVIHSFWIPSLAGKVDMIPGRATRLTLRPSKTGVLRGVCAEYCGASHALMNFPVVVMERAEFDRWLSAQAAPAQPSTEPLAARGQELFLANGCNACHTVRGTPANGRVGPDLTHIGSRRSIAADALPNDPASLQRWIAHTTEIKPGALMPPFRMLSPEDLQALATYLKGLQ